MKQTISKYDFERAFRDAGRYDQFGYESLQILFDYLEEYEESTGEEIELDVIAFCCEYSADTWQDIAQNYSIDLTECEDDEDRMAAVLDYLQDNTSVCGHTGDLIVYAIF